MQQSTSTSQGCALRGRPISASSRSTPRWPPSPGGLQSDAGHDVSIDDFIRIYAYMESVDQFVDVPDDWESRIDELDPLNRGGWRNNRDVTLPTFDDARLTDKVLLDLIDRTKIVEDTELNKGYPKGIPNDITITCTDGTKVNKRVDFPRGHAENPMTDDEVFAKFHRLADGVIAKDTADHLVEQVMKFDSLDAEGITELFRFKVL